MPLQSALNNKPLNQSEIELKQDAPESIPTKLAEVTILREIKEPETKQTQIPIQENEVISDLNESNYGKKQETEETELKELSTAEEPDKLLMNNDIVEISEEWISLNRQALSKPINEIDAERNNQPLILVRKNEYHFVWRAHQLTI